jgi:hypothetical protein
LHNFAKGAKSKKLDTVSPLQSKELKYFNNKQRPPYNQKGLSGLAQAVGENLEKVGEVVVSLSSPSSHYWQQIRGRVKKQYFLISNFAGEIKAVFSRNLHG